MAQKKVSEKKAKAVQQLQEKLGRCSIAIGADFRGMSGSAMTELRRQMRQKGTEVRVVKNTLVRIAAEKAGRPDLAKILQGPTALILGYGDAAEAAKAIWEYAQAGKTPLALRGALLDGRVLDATQVVALAKLPPRPVLAAQLLGQIQTPLLRLVYALQAPVQGLATVLQRQVEQLQKQAA